MDENKVSFNNRRRRIKKDPAQVKGKRCIKKKKNEGVGSDEMIKHAIIKASDIIRKKQRALEIGKIEKDNFNMKTLQPVVKPLQDMIHSTKLIPNVDVKNEKHILTELEDNSSIDGNYDKKSEKNDDAMSIEDPDSIAQAIRERSFRYQPYLRDQRKRKLVDTSFLKSPRGNWVNEKRLRDEEVIKDGKQSNLANDEKLSSSLVKIEQVQQILNALKREVDGVKKEQIDISRIVFSLTQQVKSLTEKELVEIKSNIRNIGGIPSSLEEKLRRKLQKGGHKNPCNLPTCDGYPLYKKTLVNRALHGIFHRLFYAKSVPHAANEYSRLLEFLKLLSQRMEGTFSRDYHHLSILLIANYAFFHTSPIHTKNHDLESVMVTSPLSLPMEKKMRLTINTPEVEAPEKFQLEGEATLNHTPEQGESLQIMMLS
ncbi:hypothetical protein QAD02_003136 [Eretmocerus hayati]|uniref:Uncharacterized protein n=1 Tax=Eretmocerus hayati TaxID=131215 RepID=A0ACC2NNR5_9HYME|nr:hypothetical protein QAD02_003136 [Eretmocerus hayati]